MSTTSHIFHAQYVNMKFLEFSHFDKQYKVVEAIEGTKCPREEILRHNELERLWSLCHLMLAVLAMTTTSTWLMGL